MKKAAFAALLIVAALPAACTWVKETPGGNAVRVAYDGNVSGCRDAGAISVSVADKVGFYHRSDLTVRDELETLARTQAAGIPADTIKATGEPANGAQSFEAYVCGKVVARQLEARPAATSDDVQTHAIKDH
jgi:hypothetical protein